MKIVKKILLLVLVLSLFTGCDLLSDDGGDDGSSFVSDYAQGIKDALTEGIKGAVSEASGEDGYYKNESLKIDMPESAQAAVGVLDANSTIAGLILTYGGCEYSTWAAFKEGIVLSFNRAAERAAGFETTEGRAGAITGTLDIFVKAISDLSIDDAITILKGYVPETPADRADDDGETAEASTTAATEYLRNTTYNDLLALFSNIIDTVLNEGLITIDGLSYSVNTIWAWFVTGVDTYNDGAGILYSAVSAPPADISDYVTGKALDGLFYLVGEAEKSIRANPVFDGASDFLVDAFEYAQDIFGDAI